MSVNADDVFNKMMGAAEGAFNEGWDAVKIYAPAEFRKMSVQIAEIAKNVTIYQIDNTQGYSPETGKLLFQMQRNSCEAVLVAVTRLTLLAVQNALNAIIKVLRDTFQGIISTIV